LGLIGGDCGENSEAMVGTDPCGFSRNTVFGDALKKRPTFSLSVLTEPTAFAKLLETFDWVLSEIKNVENTVATHS
jgi:hypothetical protein